MNNPIDDFIKRNPDAIKYHDDIISELRLLRNLPILMVSAYKHEDEIYSEIILDIHCRAFYDSLNIMKQRLLYLINITIDAKCDNPEPKKIKQYLLKNDKVLNDLLCGIIDDKEFNNIINKRHSLHHSHHLMHDSEISEWCVAFEAIKIDNGRVQSVSNDEYGELRLMEIFKQIRKLKINVTRQSNTLLEKYTILLKHLISKY